MVAETTLVLLVLAVALVDALLILALIALVLRLAWGGRKPAADEETAVPVRDARDVDPRIRR